MSMILTAGIANFSFAQPCADNLLPPMRLAMSQVLSTMNELKKQETTKETLSQLAKLNQRGLSILAQRLKQLEVGFHIVDPKADLRQVIQKQIQGYEARKSEWTHRLLSETSNPTRQLWMADLQRIDFLLDLEKQKLAQLNEDLKFQSRQPLVEQKKLAESHMELNPYIVLDHSPSNPPLINRVIDKYNVEIVLSPNYKSLALTVRASVELSSPHPRFYYPLEEVFTPNIGLNQTLLHEITHLSHRQKLDSGIEIPYAISLQADEGEKLQRERPGFYDFYMSFDELSTWNKDLNYFKTIRLGEQRKLWFKEGNVFHTADLDVARSHTAAMLKTLCLSAQDALSAVKETIKSHPESLDFSVGTPHRGNPSKVIIPYIKEGRRIGRMKVVLTKLNTHNHEQRMDILNNYLNLVETRVQLHLARAQAAL